MRRLTRKWNQFTAKILDLPQDVVQDLPRITMIGNVQLYVENHRGVLHFSSENSEARINERDTGSVRQTISHSSYSFRRSVY